MKFTLGLKNLPFKPEARQIIYAESKFNPEADAVIRHNYETIRDMFKSFSFEFCYIPILSQEYVSKDVLEYNAPYVRGEKDIHLNTLGSDFVLNYMQYPENKDKVSPSLIYYDPYYYASLDGADQLFCGVTLYELRDLWSKYSPWRKRIVLQSLFSSLEEITRDLYKSSSSRIRFQKAPNTDYEELSNAEKGFSTDIYKLLNDTRERVKKLEQLGLKKAIIRAYIFGGDKLSRLVITKDKKIKLPDYDMEIVMGPLPKAIFLLFLKHTEGIIFKDLPDYRDELVKIYRDLRGGELSEGEIQSIMDVTDPTKNNINVNCHRIQEAFINMFDEDLAKKYYITGKARKPKRIALDPDLIIWE